MKLFRLTLFLLLFSGWAMSQTFSEKLIITDSPDSVLSDAENTAFDRDGNYCFVAYGEFGGGYGGYFITKRDTLGPLKGIREMYSDGHCLNTSGLRSFDDEEAEAWYYKNGLGVDFHGPVSGKSEDAFTNHSEHAIGTVIKRGDSMHYHANGYLLSSIHKDDYSMSGARDWVSFAENGNFIYKRKTGDSEVLSLKNGTQIDNPAESYYQFKVNNNGDYIYAKGRRPLESDPKEYEYLFYLHDNDSSFGPVRTAWDSYLQEDGAYYFSGDDNGPSYILVNSVLFKNLDKLSDITLVDKKNYFFTCTKDDQKHIIVNGQPYELDVEKLFHPAMDKNGNFALYGLKEYYLYKIINGVTQKEPISQYGVRPTPLYISPTGESLHYFKTDDSTYIYRDDEMLFPAFSNDIHFTWTKERDFLDEPFIDGKPEPIHDLFYLELDTIAYMVLNGAFSKPMITIDSRTWYPKPNKGSVMSGALSNDGFYLIQNTGESTWLININNTHYHTLEKVDRVFAHNCYFNGQELIFYGQKGLSFFQFKISL